MNIIEKAAKRLEALRQAGVEVPEVAPRAALRRPMTLTPSAAAPDALARPTSGAQSRRIELDIARLAAAGFITPDAPRSELAEQFDMTKPSMSHHFAVLEDVLLFVLLMTEADAGRCVDVDGAGDAEDA